MNKKLFSRDKILEKKFLTPDDEEYELLGKMFGPPHMKCEYCDTIVVAKAQIGLWPRMEKHLKDAHTLRDGKCPSCGHKIPEEIFDEEKLEVKEMLNECPYCLQKVFKE